MKSVFTISLILSTLAIVSTLANPDYECNLARCI